MARFSSPRARPGRPNYRPDRSGKEPPVRWPVQRDDFRIRAPETEKARRSRRDPAASIKTAFTSTASGFPRSTSRSQDTRRFRHRKPLQGRPEPVRSKAHVFQTLWPAQPSNPIRSLQPRESRNRERSDRSRLWPVEYGKQTRAMRNAASPQIALKVLTPLVRHQPGSPSRGSVQDLPPGKCDGELGGLRNIEH